MFSWMFCLMFWGAISKRTPRLSSSSNSRPVSSMYSARADSQSCRAAWKSASAFGNTGFRSCLRHTKPLLRVFGS